MKDKFETGNYPKDHPSGILTRCNKKVAGIMKDETGGKISEDFFWLRAEIYSSKMHFILYTLYTLYFSFSYKII